MLSQLIHFAVSDYFELNENIVIYEMEGITNQGMEILGVLEASTKIRPNDRLVLMGQHESIHKLTETN